MTNPLEQFYKPVKGARLRDPVDGSVVPAYGVRVISNHSVWARRVRDGDAERIDRPAFEAGRDQAQGRTPTPQPQAAPEPPPAPEPEPTPDPPRARTRRATKGK